MRDTIGAVHRDAQGCPDYVSVLTLDYQQESGQWVGVCVELGTSAFADTPEQADLELREAVELQLSEMERLTHLREYLAVQGVPVIPLEPATAGAAAGFDLVAAR